MYKYMTVCTPVYLMWTTFYYDAKQRVTWRNRINIFMVQCYFCRVTNISSFRVCAKAEKALED